MTTTPEQLALLKPAVRSALQGIEHAYSPTTVLVHADGQGGAWIRLASVPLSRTYEQGETFAIFLLPFNLPGVDVYPLFVRPDLTRGDGAPLGPAFQTTTLAWTGEPSQMQIVQVSRRTQGDFAAQTPAQKVEKVLAWIRDH